MARPVKQYSYEELSKAFFGPSKSEAKKEAKERGSTFFSYNENYNPKLLKRIDRKGFNKAMDLVKSTQDYTHYHRELSIYDPYRYIYLIQSQYPVNCNNRYHYELIGAIPNFDEFSKNLTKYGFADDLKHNQLQLIQTYKDYKIKEFYFVTKMFAHLWDAVDPHSYERHPNGQELGQGIWRFNIQGEEFPFIHTNILSTHKLTQIQQVIHPKRRIKIINA